MFGTYDGEHQRLTRLKIRPLSQENAGHSFVTTSDSTFKKALQAPDNLTANLIDYVAGRKQ
ncbi:hypothetical protein D3C74_127140 [compost metagenome]